MAGWRPAALTRSSWHFFYFLCSSLSSPGGRITLMHVCQTRGPGAKHGPPSELNFEEWSQTEFLFQWILNSFGSSEFEFRFLVFDFFFFLFFLKAVFISSLFIEIIVNNCSQYLGSDVYYCVLLRSLLRSVLVLIWTLHSKHTRSATPSVCSCSSSHLVQVHGPTTSCSQSHHWYSLKYWVLSSSE